MPGQHLTKGISQPLRCPQPPNHKYRVHYMGRGPYAAKQTLSPTGRGRDVGLTFSRRTLLGATAQLTMMGAATPLVSQSALLANAVPLAEFGASQAAPSPPTHYVSSAGDDQNDGLTPQTAWATIQKANMSLPKDRSIVLFRRGDTFYGELNLPFGCEVGAYGTGDRPVLTMFKLLNQANGWMEHSHGVWKIDLGSPETHSGYTATNDANIGFLMVDNVMKPALKFDLSGLTSVWDFYCDIPNHTLFVATPDNPTSLASEIKAAPNGNTYGASGTVISCERGENNVHDVHVTGSGGCGIRGSGRDVRIHGCVIDYIGGSELLGFYAKNARYGNGIENWPNVMRWTIENNEIAHVYDVAWSPQGRSLQGSPVSWQDLVVRDNYIHDCGQTIELWSESSNTESPGFVRIRFEGNRCERAGYGAFSDVRPDQNVRVHLLTYRLQTPVDITIQNNVFEDAYSAYSYHAFEPPNGYITRNNTIRMKAGHKMQSQRPETVEQAAAWQAVTEREAGSTITSLS